MAAPDPVAREVLALAQVVTDLVACFPNCPPRSAESESTNRLLIRDLTSLQDYSACVALQEATWGQGFSERVPTAILRVSQMIGGVAAGAFDDDGRMAGFVFGLTGVRGGELVHWSDMLAVRRDQQRQGIGEQLKRYQRDKVMAIGVQAMLWTFDPLQAGNAHFNINRLGALPAEYIVDMYGLTGSTLHGPLPTDRFVVRWELMGSTARVEMRGTPPLANPVGPDGMPTTALLPSLSPGLPVVAVQVPSDMSVVHQMGRSLAMRWRLGVREVMTAWLGAGYRVTGFVQAGAPVLPYYVLERPAP